ncbi:MAG: preprotein translocase subunit SecE [Lachnospiraceae bacterium]|nr:preprotein translocase subunit SecE [Lachnospiraceae bacterium]
MGETTNSSATGTKKGFSALKAEFKKIMWPTKDDVVKRSIAVLVSTTILGVVIALLDYVIKYALELLFK